MCTMFLLSIKFVFFTVIAVYLIGAKKKFLH